MKQTIDRRHWLKTGFLAAAALSSGQTRAFQWIEEWTEESYDPDVNGLVRLHMNENPYGPGPMARKALIDALDEGNRYPLQARRELREAIAEVEGLEPHNVLITAGSSEVLGLMGLIYGIEKGNIISGFPTFPTLMEYSKVFGSKWEKVPLNNHNYDLAAISGAITDETQLVFVCNPNNPTGTYHPAEVIAEFCREHSSRTPIFIDEAYIEFTADGIRGSLAPMVRNNKNIIVGRTFSKVYGLAGLRVGYALGHTDVISRMQQFNMGRNMTASVCSMAAAQASLLDDEFRKKCVDKNREGLRIVFDHFDAWGVEYAKSITNFIWFSLEKFPSDLRNKLESDKILVRTYDYAPGWCRVSVGKPEEMKAFVKSAEKYL